MAERIVTRPPQVGIVSCEIAGMAMRLPGVSVIDSNTIGGRVVLDYGYPETGVVVVRSVHRRVGDSEVHTHRLLGLPRESDADVVEFGRAS